ncbi:MAG: hypothetical protein JXO51_01820, partial [Candidatus Aminicenantes bacterium]|nr:hypothetical protein [Candidatus Aminicenantes bacterium]
MKISVSLSYNLCEPLTYRVAGDSPRVGAGTRVLVPLGNRVALAWVLAPESAYGGRLKDIIGVVDDPFVPDDSLLEFTRRAASAYFVSAGSLLDLGLPPSQKGIQGLRLEVEGRERRLSEFTAAALGRMAAAGPLRLFFRSPAPAPPGPVAAELHRDGAPPSRLLLAPVRGREYREACERVLHAGGSVILLAPDIATSAYWQSLIPASDPYHSAVRPAAREKTWREYRLGKSGVVCGGLSALTLPLPRPGLLIIDRASSPLFARPSASPLRLDHLAEIRAQAGKFPLLRGASSHSCATFLHRDGPGVDDRRPPRDISCQVHALKGGERGIPESIMELVRQNTMAGRKTLVLVNRVQPSVHLFCRECRRIASCPRCGGVLKVEEGRAASCRRCAFRSAGLEDCPRCGRPLEPLQDISIDSLSRAVTRVCGEEAVLALTAAELKDPAAAVAAAAEHPVVIATLAALSPHFQGMFA